MCSDCCASPFFALTILRPPLLPTEARQAEAPSAATGPADVFGKRDACSDGGFCVFSACAILQEAAAAPHTHRRRGSRSSQMRWISRQQRDPHKAVAMLEDLVVRLVIDSLAGGKAVFAAFRRHFGERFAPETRKPPKEIMIRLRFRNDKVATQLQLLGALTGYVPSLQSTAFRLLFGDGVQPDCWAALSLYKQVAETVGEQQLRNPLIPLLPLPPSVRFSEHTKTERREQQNAQRQQDDVLQYWEAQAKNDDPVASYELAKLLEQQQQQEQQQSPADDARKRRVAELLQKAGESNMGAALRDLALAHLHGNGVPHDVGKAVDLLHKAAAAGDADAQNYIGYFYWVGTEEGLDGSSSSSSGQSGGGGSVLKKDPVKAEEYFSMAALQEHPEAFYFLGEIKQHQANEVKDEKEKSTLLTEAIRHYGRAAEGGYHLAWLREAEALEAQANKLQDLPDGKRACEAAALVSPWRRRTRVGVSFAYQAFKTAGEFGAGADSIRRALQLYYEKDYDGALLLSLAAAEEGIEGNVQALREIGLMHANGEEGATRDEGLALQVLMRALSLGDLQAIPPLAVTLEGRARGQPRLLQRAEEMLRYFLESGGPRETDGAPDIFETGSPRPPHQNAMKGLSVSLGMFRKPFTENCCLYKPVALGLLMVVFPHCQESVVLINCQGHLLGRLASVVAKEILNGQRVVCVKCENINISGSLHRNRLKYQAFLRLRVNSNPKRGPFHLRAPSRIFWRAVRGMIRHKTIRGKKALSRLEVRLFTLGCVFNAIEMEGWVYEGVPVKYERKKKLVVPQALRAVRLRPGRNFCRLGELSASVGWSKSSLISRLEDQRKARSAKFFKRQQTEAKARVAASKEVMNSMPKESVALLQESTIPVTWAPHTPSQLPLDGSALGSAVAEVNVEHSMLTTEKGVIGLVALKVLVLKLSKAARSVACDKQENILVSLLYVVGTDRVRSGQDDKATTPSTRIPGQAIAVESQEQCILRLSRSHEVHKVLGSDSTSYEPEQQQQHSFLSTVSCQGAKEYYIEGKRCTTSQRYQNTCLWRHA
ncbi:60s ribosomal protein [Cyclospora cayetanensis]|uniref:60s ribosomal protein n=1 Tax=Cyclospora cayetanensis TaxID=88456 RepID=A0A1D3D7X7_9EIME|nr:60s ribosomal protein [Cyclospora cayetanensis]